MTAVVLISLYFIALTAFLGLDIINKVPATMYALVLAALGTLAAVGVAGALIVANVVASGDRAGGLALLAIALGAAAVGAGVAAITRLVRPLVRPAGRVAEKAKAS